jgi:hypothetical protein
MSEKRDQQFSPAETAKRRDQALMRALSTPPKPHRGAIKKKAAKRPKSVSK